MAITKNPNASIVKVHGIKGQCWIQRCVQSLVGGWQPWDFNPCIFCLAREAGNLQPPGSPGETGFSPFGPQGNRNIFSAAKTPGPSVTPPRPCDISGSRPRPVLAAFPFGALRASPPPGSQCVGGASAVGTGARPALF